MRIENGRVVRLEYEMKDCDGVPVEDEGAHLEYLHGGSAGSFPRSRRRSKARSPATR
jgi:FKBP-type peptidyl-prolyl cis-trans isomerase 2